MCYDGSWASRETYEPMRGGPLQTAGMRCHQNSLFCRGSFNGRASDFDGVVHRNEPTYSRLNGKDPKRYAVVMGVRIATVGRNQRVAGSTPVLGSEFNTIIEVGGGGTYLRTEV